MATGSTPRWSLGACSPTKRGRWPTPSACSTASTTRSSCSTSTGSIGIVTRGDFGFSFYYNRDVGLIVAERLPRTILLALTCHILASVIGISLGIIAATRQYSWADQLLSALSFIGMTVPALPAGPDHALHPCFQARRAELRHLLFRAVRWRALVVGKVRRPRAACVARCLHRDFRRARLQYARHARQPARYAQRPIHRDGASQGSARNRQ